MIFKNGDWGLGIGDWGLGPNPQYPIPNPQSPIPKLLNIITHAFIYLINLILKYYYFIVLSFFYSSCEAMTTPSFLTIT